MCESLNRLQNTDLSSPLNRYVNIFLTTLFLWPLFRSNHANKRVRQVAIRTLLFAMLFIYSLASELTCLCSAAGVSLTTSTMNIALLGAKHGKELGWICLGLCGLDVMPFY
jgi:hypothetical protein